MSIRVDETRKPDIEATEPAIPTTCSPEDLPDEELLYDLADLFRSSSDTTRIKILYALMGRESSAWRTSPKRPKPRSPRCRTSCAHSSSRTWLNSDATGAISLLARRRPRLHHARRALTHLRIATNHGTSAACASRKYGKGIHHEKAV